MKNFRKGAAILSVAAMLFFASNVNAASSLVYVSTSDSQSISLKNYAGKETEKSIDGIIGSAQPKKISRVIAVKCESEESVPADIYIRVSAGKKSILEKLGMEITDSHGGRVKSSRVILTEEYPEEVYSKEFYLGCFNRGQAVETRLFTIVSDKPEEIEMTIVARADERKKDGIILSNIKEVGTETGKIRPGTYLLTTSDQIRILTALKEVSLFSVSGIENELVELNEGDKIEYCNDVYLESYDAATSGSNKRRLLNINSLFKLLPGYCTEIRNGSVRIYDADGILKEVRQLVMPYERNVYILKYGEKISATKETGTGASRLEDGVIYTVGLDIGAGDYTGTGEGLVRVYDSEGYAKTVIRLKEENSSAQGVESYVFKLSENETFVAEGNIEFKKVEISQ